MAEDKIIITLADGSTQQVPLTYRGVTIGSGSRNDIILNGEGISQQHLRITFDGSHYHVLRLPATLPAYLDDFQLLPSVQRAWEAGQRLKVGENQLELEKVQDTAGTYNEGPRAGQPLMDTATPTGSQSTGPQPFRFLLIGFGIVIVIVILYIIFGP
jgi:hypothetical protein